MEGAGGGGRGKRAQTAQPPARQRDTVGGAEENNQPNHQQSTDGWGAGTVAKQSKRYNVYIANVHFKAGLKAGSVEGGRVRQTGAAKKIHNRHFCEEGQHLAHCSRGAEEEDRTCGALLYPHAINEEQERGDVGHVASQLKVRQLNH